MRMVINPGVKPRTGTIYRNFLQQAGFAQHPKRIVNRRQRHCAAVPEREQMQALGRNVLVSLITDQQSRQRNPLAGWLQSRGAQPVQFTRIDLSHGEFRLQPVLN